MTRCVVAWFFQLYLVGSFCFGLGWVASALFAQMPKDSADDDHP